MRQNVYKNPLISFCVDHHMLGVAPTHKRSLLPTNSFGENRFFLYKQLSTGDTFLVRHGACVHIPSQHWDPPWLTPVQVMRMLPVSVRLYVCQSCVWKTFVPWCLLSPLELTVLLHPFPHSSLNPEESHLIKKSHLRLRVPKSLTVCTLTRCRSLCWFPSTARGCRSLCWFLPTARGSISDVDWTR